MRGCSCGSRGALRWEAACLAPFPPAALHGAHPVRQGLSSVPASAALNMTDLQKNSICSGCEYHRALLISGGCYVRPGMCDKTPFEDLGPWHHRDRPGWLQARQPLTSALLLVLRLSGCLRGTQPKTALIPLLEAKTTFEDVRILILQRLAEGEGLVCLVAKLS